MHSGTETVVAIPTDGFVINQVGDTKENQNHSLYSSLVSSRGRLSLDGAGKVAVGTVIYC